MTSIMAPQPARCWAIIKALGAANRARARWAARSVTTASMIRMSNPHYLEVLASTGGA
jgi:hypothetical protein